MMVKPWVLREWAPGDQEQVIDLIVGIQRDEFGISITREDQPDLRKVREVYQKDNGNFWVAVANDVQLAGSIGLVNFAPAAVALRKMFVAKEFRSTGLAQDLLNKALNWCRDKNLSDVYLGTIDVFKSAHRFYEKNGFVRIDVEKLPESFPRMKVDTIFYHLNMIV